MIQTMAMAVENDRLRTTWRIAPSTLWDVNVDAAA